MTAYDYLIVGAGTAGCVLAARLSEDPNVRVLLIEAGGSNRRLTIQMPAAVPFAYTNPALNWGYVSGPEPHLDDRVLDERRGRVIGGSSSINAMIYNRGNPMDYEGWAQTGLTDWSWSRCLPYFKRMETFSGGADAWRGGEGPLRVSRCKADQRLHECFLRAGEQAGHEQTDDHNGFRQEGLHVAQAYIHAGRRVTTATAYLEPALARRNLTIRSNLSVKRIVFSGQRAVALEVKGPTGTERLEAGREIILAAGAFGSPQMLMLSGIGDADDLSALGIPLVANRREVGRNLENHPGVNIQYTASKADSIISSLGPFGRVKLGLEWLVLKQGLGSTNFFETGAFLRTRPEVAFPNMQFEFLPLVRFMKEGKLHAIPGFQFWMDLSRPISRGAVTLTSSNPDDHPRIVFNHLADEQDRRDLLDGVKMAREMIAQPAWDGIREREISPGPQVQSDADIMAWLKASVGTSYHPSGTCRMGADDDAVVNAEGLVRGIEALRVVDASIMPRTVTANLSAAVAMMAEKMSDTIRSRHLPADHTPYYGMTLERPTRQRPAREDRAETG